jgi:uroporphyrinogen-III decarboxylase
MTFGAVERPMFAELFGPLVGLEAEWRAQGASEEEINLTAFDWDYVPVSGCGGHTAPRGLPPVTLEETSDYLVQRDYLGRTVKLCKATATIPLPLDFPVKTMDDWRRLKPMFEFAPDRIDPAQMARARQSEAWVLAGMPGAFDIARELMGEELACLAYYDQPELMADIVQTLSDTTFAVLERVSREVRIDQLSVHEDFAGKSGPLVGPDIVRAYFRPYYRRIWEMLAERGTRVFQLDSDGNLQPVLDALLDGGLTSIFPMEPAAGMDIVAVRRQYGQRLAMLGGIDKHVLRRDRAAIRRELEYKLQPALRAGMVFGLDHRIPNGTPLENYRYYVDLGREILGLPPRQPHQRGWGRMAF